MTAEQKTPDDDATESCGLLSRRGIFDSNPIDANTNVVNHPTSLALANLPLDRHPVAVYLASLSPGSRRTQRAALRIIATLVSPEATELSLPWWALDFAHTSAIVSKLAEKFAPATATRMLAALRGVLKSAFKLGLMGSDHMTRACSVEPVRGSRVIKGRALSSGELRTLFETCNPNTPGGARNAALLGLAYEQGSGAPRSSRSTSSTSTRRLARLPSRAKATRSVGATWQIEVVTRSMPGSRSVATRTPPFHPVTKGGTILRHRMTDGAVAELVKRLARRSKIAAFSPHDMRRTFIGDLLDGGADIATVQQLARAAPSPTTTSRYETHGGSGEEAGGGTVARAVRAAVSAFGPKGPPSGHRAEDHRPSPGRALEPHDHRSIRSAGRLGEAASR